MEKYILIRSNRKTLSVSFNEKGEIIVKAPLFLDKKRIERFIAEKEEWINRNQKRIRKSISERERFNIKEGAFLYLLGDKYTVKYSDEKRFAFTDGCFIMPHVDFEIARKHVILLYKKIAKKVFESRVLLYKQKHGFCVGTIKVNSASKRWGSCSGKNNINFSWKLVLGDMECIDYVVVHELCHTIEHNHSKKFWALVENIMPNYKLIKKKLLNLQHEIDKQCWDIK